MKDFFGVRGKFWLSRVVEVAASNFIIAPSHVMGIVLLVLNFTGVVLVSSQMSVILACYG